MPLSLILTLVITHWVADWVWQDDAMAIGKSSSNLVLTDHVSVYTTGLYFATIGWSIWYGFHGVGTMMFPPINGVLHWVTDYYTSRRSARLWKAERRHVFFVNIGMDQLVHYIALFVTASWLLI